jgi:hypothetical protein
MKKILITLITVLSFSILSSSQQNYDISPVVPSLISQDNVCAGFMVTLKSGRIIHFFRLDPGINGNHRGNGGRLVKRYTDDDGKTWTKPITVFDDKYDDRNVTGCILKTGRIVLFFRRLSSDLTNHKHIDYNFIYSDDNGETWSLKQEIKSEGKSGESANLTFVPGWGYMREIFDIDYIETRYSLDGTDWSNMGYVWDYRKDKKFNINESCFTYTKDGKIIGLMRDNIDHTEGRNYFQVSSADYGKTWTELQRTNIANGYYCANPLIFYDDASENIIAIATDRREHNPVGYFKGQIWVYVNKVEEVFNKPDNWNLVSVIPRPNPNYYIMYGYPCFAKKKDGGFLIVFTEAFIEGGHEHADFYQFEINNLKKR